MDERETPDTALSFGLLGRPWAAASGAELAIPSGQAWLLLAYLLERRGQSIDRSELVDALWPDAPPERADIAVRALLSRLRAALGHELLRGRGWASIDSLEDAWIDVEHLRRLHGDARRAAATGEAPLAARLAWKALDSPDQPYLAGFDLPWVRERRRELDEGREEMLTIVAESALALGGSWVSPGRRAARQLADLRPLSQTVTDLVMRSEIAAGDEPMALLAYENLRQRLRRELDVIPGAALRDLHASLLGEAPRGPEPVSYRPSAASRSANHTSRQYTATFAYGLAATTPRMRTAALASFNV